MEAKNDYILFDLIDNLKHDSMIDVVSKRGDLDIQITPNKGVGVLDGEVFYFLHYGGFYRIGKRYLVHRSCVFKRSDRLVKDNIVLCKKTEFRQEKHGMEVYRQEFFVVEESNVAEVVLGSAIIINPYSSFKYLDDGKEKWLVEKQDILIVCRNGIYPGPDYVFDDGSIKYTKTMSEININGEKKFIVKKTDIYGGEK